MKKILLSQNKFALVDDDDFNLLNQFKWSVNKLGIKKQCYAIRVRNKKAILMHRLIMNCPKGMQIDHINHNTLDNRRNNLRICTRQQNLRNQAKRDNATSFYQGVSSVKFHKKYKYWRGKIGNNWATTFNSELHAAMARDIWAREYQDEFIPLNFPNAIYFKN